MNYLAHLYLAGDSAECLLGSILGDFVRGAVKNQYPVKVKRGIELHRKIDAYTDSHAMTRASRRLYSPLRRRFAGIIVDLCYDHFLYRHWPKFSDSNLDRFIARAYDTLIAHQAMLPQRLHNMIPAMVRNDWLGSYRDLSGVEQALVRLAKRMTNGGPLAGAIDEVRPNYRQLEMNFLMFFPDLIRYVNEFKSTTDRSVPPTQCRP